VADVLIALGGNVGDVRATFQKAIANICGMTQAALLARSSESATPPWCDEQQARIQIGRAITLHECANLLAIALVAHVGMDGIANRTPAGQRTLCNTIHFRLGG